MFTKEQAKAKMQEYVDFQNNLFIWNDGYNPEIIIYENLTQERDFGWIFFWQVKNVKEDYSNVIVGNGPIIVEKKTLNMYKMGTGLDPEEYIKVYLKNKNKLGKLEKNNKDIWNITNFG